MPSRLIGMRIGLVSWMHVSWMLAPGCTSAPDEELDDPQTNNSSTPNKGSAGASNDSDSVSDSNSDSDPDPSDASSQSENTDKNSATPDKPKQSKDWDKLLQKVFPDDRVVEIEIDFEEPDLTSILESWKRDRKKVYAKSKVSWDGVQLSGCGARLKGYSSLMFVNPKGPGGGLTTSSKLPLKVNFDRFGGKRLHHVDRVSLGTNAFDRSQMRERLSVRMFRAMGVPAAKTAFATLRADGTSVGLYTIAQNIDKRFLKQHFGTKDGADDGNLYKCVALQRHGGPGGAGGPVVCSLRWQGDKKSDYLRSEGCAVGYEECGLVLKTNEENPSKNDYSDLIHFLDVLNNSEDDEFAQAIQEVFEVDSFLRLLAVNVGMVNLDSYIGRINNYYLYHQPANGKFIMLPWDLNMSYGHYDSSQGREDLTQFSAQDPLAGQRHGKESYPLVNRILSVPEFKERYLDYLREFVELHFNVEVHQGLIEEFDALLREPLSADPNRGFSMQDYERAIGSDPDGKSKGMFPQYNLMDFVQRRAAFLEKTL